MTTDPLLPFTECPAGDDELYVVRGRWVGPLVEVSLNRESRQKHHFKPETDTVIEVLAVRRLPDPQESTAMDEYASNLEDAARYAARGELGYYVETVAEGSGARVSLVARLLGPDGRLTTDIPEEQYLDGPDADAAAIEKAAELQARADELNDEWISLRRARVLELQEQYRAADA